MLLSFRASGLRDKDDIGFTTVASGRTIHALMHFKTAFILVLVFGGAACSGSGASSGGGSASSGGGSASSGGGSASSGGGSASSGGGSASSGGGSGSSGGGSGSSGGGSASSGGGTAAGAAFKQLSAGNFHTCAVNAAGLGYCWGKGDDGQLGTPNASMASTPTAVASADGGAPLTFVSIVAGGFHSCGLTTTGEAYCWGKNGNGQLGDGQNSQSSPRPVPVASPDGGARLQFTQLATGTNHTCGITTSGAAYCWGNNDSKQVSSVNNAFLRFPVAVPPPAGGQSLTFTELSAGTSYTCGLSGGGAYCWGSNSEQQLGNGSPSTASTPTKVLGIDGGTPLVFTSLSAGQTHACGMSGGAAYCWGSNGYGQLGNGSKLAGPFPTPVATPNGVTFTQVTAGSHYVGLVFTCARSSTGAAYCWGNGGNNQLGNGLGMDSPTPVAVSAPAGGSALSFTRLSAGGLHGCGLLADDSAFCWGTGGNGQLGQGSPATSPVPVKVAAPL